MATHFSIPARRIPWTEEPSGLQSIEWHRVGQDLGDLAHCFAKPRETHQAPALKNCLNPRGFDEGFYNSGSKMGADQISESQSVSHLVLSNSLWPRGL